MTMPTLGAPAPRQFPALGSQQRISLSSQGSRNKIQLTPGHSLMDWIRLGKSGRDMTGVGGRRFEVTQEELEKHNKTDDAWIALRGNVYNATPYLDFHPGGVEELMRGAGKDCTALFDEIHKWVNAESMLEKCFIGKLKTEKITRKGNELLRKRLSDTVLPPSFPSPASSEPQPPKFDWFQTGKTVSIVVYTKWAGMRHEFVIIDREQKCLLLTLHLKDFVFYIHVDLECDITDTYNVSVTGDMGKVDIVLHKSTPDVQWPTLGRYLEKHNEFIKNSKYNPAYRDCTVEQVSPINKDSKLYCIRQPPGTRLCVPEGYHVCIKSNIVGMKIVRSYTTILPSLDPDRQDPRVQDGTVLYLMIKIYPDGVVTPVISQLQPGDKLTISSYLGNFELSRLQQCSHLVMFCAGTGFTPMVSLIYRAVIEDTSRHRQVKLLFFNKTQADILWREELNDIAEKYENFTFENCLSEPDDEWTGLTGRVTKEMIRNFMPTFIADSKLLMCNCGPPPFMEIVTKFADEEGFTDNMHGFTG